MGRGTDVRVQCPFYVEEAGCGNLTPKMKAAHEQLTKKRIRCEGITKGGKIYIDFGSPEEKKDYCENFCYSNCYKGCPVAQMLLEQYGCRNYKIMTKGRC